MALSGVAPPVAAAAPTLEELCTPTDPGLEELSGLAVADGQIYAVGDSGTDDRVAVLDMRCHVQRWLPVPIDPRDVEDLAVGPDGWLWLADIGDNGRQRETVALIGMARDGAGDGTLLRLTYPDGPHDAEALLLGADGVPVIVTKEIFGPAGVYVPAGAAGLGDLAEPGPSPLEKVGSVQISPTDTPGGPIPGVNLPAITGGAVSAAGDVVALRTYTDLYLYPVGQAGLDGEGADWERIVAALAGEPIRAPLPDQPQGEAIAFTAEGDVLGGSEAGGRPGGGLLEGASLPPIIVLRAAVALASTAGSSGVAVPTAPGPAADESEPTGARTRNWGVGIVAAVVLGVGIAVGLAGVGRRRTR